MGDVTREEIDALAVRVERIERRLGPEMCSSRDPVSTSAYLCSLEAYHDSPHVARDGTGRVLSSWP